MPTVLRIGGFRFFFFSNEGVEPPHVHVESADNYAKFWLAPVSLAQSIGYNSGELNTVRRLVEQNRPLFLERWNDYFGDA